MTRRQPESLLRERMVETWPQEILARRGEGLVKGGAAAQLIRWMNFHWERSPHPLQDLAVD